jgi:hypothetical protein
MEITVAAMLEEIGVGSIRGMVMRLLLLLPEGLGGKFEPLDRQRYDFDEI